MVRLKVEDPDVDYIAMKFQFLDGAIKSIEQEKAPVLILISIP